MCYCKQNININKYEKYNSGTKNYFLMFNPSLNFEIISVLNQNIIIYDAVYTIGKVVSNHNKHLIDNQMITLILWMLLADCKQNVTIMNVLFE